MFPPMTGRKVRNAVVGCGRIAATHFRNRAKHSGNMELAAICDNNSEPPAARAEKYRVPAFSDPAELLENADCGLMTICTPGGLHLRMVMETAQRGRQRNPVSGYCRPPDYDVRAREAGDDATCVHGFGHPLWYKAALPCCAARPNRKWTAATA